MSKLDDAARKIIETCNEMMNRSDPSPVTIKSVTTKGRTSEMVGIVGPGKNFTLNAKHGGEYAHGSLSSILPLGASDLEDVKRFLTTFMLDHKSFISSKK